eukprot:scaffold224891_cov36-Tisochrysis_lutea.AAC.6
MFATKAGRHAARQAFGGGIGGEGAGWKWSASGLIKVSLLPAGTFAESRATSVTGSGGKFSE